MNYHILVFHYEVLHLHIISRNFKFEFAETQYVLRLNMPSGIGRALKKLIGTQLSTEQAGFCFPIWSNTFTVLLQVRLVIN